MLETIAWSEGAGHPLDYDTIAYGKVIKSNSFPDLVGKVGSPQNPLKLPDLSKYPDILVKWRPGRGAETNTTAVGRYQFLKSDFRNAWNKFGPVPDFSSGSQDLVAVEDMILHGMIDPLLKDDPQQAIFNGKGEWSSFPGSPNEQGTMPLKDTLAYYNKALGNCRNSQKK